VAEIEIKVLGVDIERLKERLETLGAQFLFQGKVKCLHFDQGSFLKDARKLFRLRRWEGENDFPSKFEICYKGPKQIIDGCKVREEIETTVENAQQFEGIVRGLGFVVTMDNDKRRESYQWGEIHVDIDAYPGVPVYIEIEGPNPAAIDKALRELNLTEYERSTESADELFERLWPDIDFAHLKF